MAGIVYEYLGGVYVNITNKCPCSCDFCIRKNGPGVGTAENLFFEKQPSCDEVLAALRTFDFSPYEEIVFCGYGEPFSEFEILKSACAFVKNILGKKVRVNTNGLGDLINGRSTVSEISPFIDTISVSLNASDAEKYSALCHPSFGIRSYQAMLDFTASCIGRIPRVVMSLVDTVGADEINKCRAIATAIGAEYRVREYTAPDEKN